MPNGDNEKAPMTWKEWSQKISEQVEVIDEKLDNLIIEFHIFKTKMNVKSGIFAIVGSLLSFGVMLAVLLIKKVF